MVKPADKRKAVDCLKTEQSLSQNRSCRLVNINASTYGYKSVRKDDSELREKIGFLANAHKRYGWKRIYETLKEKGVQQNINNVFPDFLKLANIKNFRFHDLRHTVANRWVEKGIDLIVIKELLGHADIKTTMRYAHALPGIKLRAVQILNDY